MPINDACFPACDGSISVAFPSLRAGGTQGSPGSAFSHLLEQSWLRFTFPASSAHFISQMSSHCKAKTNMTWLLPGQMLALSVSQNTKGFRLRPGLREATLAAVGPPLRRHEDGAGSRETLTQPCHHPRSVPCVSPQRPARMVTLALSRCRLLGAL